jgi:hypothetical protein
MRALISRFGKEEVKTWEFATWTDPLNPEGKNNAHMVLPKSVLKAGQHDEAVATIIATSIDVAMTHDLPIHIGNFAGAVEQNYPKIIGEIRRFPKGDAYLEYINGYAISRYKVKPGQDIGKMLQKAFSLLENPDMPNKPLFIDEFGDLIGDDGVKPLKSASSLKDAFFVGKLLARVFNRYDGQARTPRRVAFWNSGITSRAKYNFSQFDDYLKSPATNVIAMFASLNGYNKLLVPSKSIELAAGVKNGRIKIILIPDENLKGNEDRRPIIAADTLEIKFNGLKPNANYQVSATSIDAQHGNSLAVYLGGEADYRQDKTQRIAKIDGEWKFSSKYWEQCFFDEIKGCVWREKAHLIDSPLIRNEQSTTDATGALTVSMFLPEVAAAMVDVIELE